MADVPPKGVDYLRAKIKSQVSMTKTKRGPDLEGLIKKEQHKEQKALKSNYLSDTDLEEYKDYPKLLDMTAAERHARVLRLWRTCFNCSIGVAIMLE